MNKNNSCIKVTIKKIIAKKGSWRAADATINDECMRIVGNIDIQENLSYMVTGKISTHPTYGDQFVAKTAVPAENFPLKDNSEKKNMLTNYENTYPTDFVQQTLFPMENESKAEQKDNDSLRLSESDIEITVRGHITKVFHEGSNGWCSARFSTEDGRYFIIKGTNIPNPSDKPHLEITGKKIHDPKYGEQIEVESAFIVVEENEKDMIAYLSGKTFKGIGKKMAKRIIDYTGVHSVLNVLENDPETLLNVKGMTREKLNSLIKGVEMNNLAFALQKRMAGHLTMGQIVKIIDAYGKKSLDKINENPYQMVYDIDGFGFQTVDKIAMNLGFSKTSPNRIEEGVIYALKELSDVSGNVYCYLDELLNKSVEVLFPPNLPANKRLVYFRKYTSEEQRRKVFEKNFTPEEMQNLLEYDAGKEDREILITNAINKNIDNGKIIYETENNEFSKQMENGKVYWKKLYDAEVNSAKILCDLCTKKPIRSFNMEDIMDKITEYEEAQTEKLRKQTGDENLEFVLEEEQKQAVQNTLLNRIHVITGGPGRGKTTILDCIMYVWNDDESVILAAPTGRASQKMKESTGREASTIARKLLYMKQTKEYPTECLVVIDESSMLDILDFSNTLRAYKDCQIVFVGDVDQLPSVGPGMVLRDMVNSEYISTTKLIKGHRNQGNIAKNANLINLGKSSRYFSFGEDFSIIEKGRPDIMSEIKQQYADYIKKGYQPKDIGILSAQKKTGAASVYACNQEIQEMLNPENIDNKIPEMEYRVGDRVMQTKNHHAKEGRNIYTNEKINGIFNGDCGTITEYDDEEKELTLITDDGREFVFDLADGGEMILAYAITIHKSQGSEYPIVLMPFSMAHYMMLRRNIIYTGITRAKKEIRIVGELKAVNMAIHNTEYTERHSDLLQRIKKGIMNK